MNTEPKYCNLILHICLGFKWLECGCCWLGDIIFTEDGTGCHFFLIIAGWMLSQLVQHQSGGFLCHSSYIFPLASGCKDWRTISVAGATACPPEDFAPFNYFASSLIGFKKELRNIMTFGIDREKDPVEALANCTCLCPHFCLHFCYFFVYK